MLSVSLISKSYMKAVAKLANADRKKNLSCHSVKYKFEKIRVLIPFDLKCA